MALMSDDLPPRVPPELPEMDRLVMLLGFRSKCVDLSARVRAELIALCGAYPDPLTAARWKQHLREIRAELAAEPDPEAG
jgi:hypothetical protein